MVGLNKANKGFMMLQNALSIISPRDLTKLLIVEDIER